MIVKTKTSLYFPGIEVLQFDPIGWCGSESDL